MSRDLVSLQSGDLATTSSLVRIARDGDLPLSFGQQWMWFLDQFVPHNIFYNFPLAYRLFGPLDHRALECALSELVARHEVLRTRFENRGGRPRQLIADATPVALPIVDLSDQDDPEAAARRLARDEALRPFDLAESPLLRARLGRLGEEDNVLMITFHHIAFDGWSGRVFLTELSALYRAFVKRQPSPLSPLALQYADFASWQQSRFENGMIDDEVKYWRKQLRDAPLILEVPIDHPRPPVPSGMAGRIAFEVAPETNQALNHLSRSEGATLFMVVLAAFKLLLFRATGQDDLVVGCPAAGRTRVELEPIVGMFTNVLVFRTDCTGDPTFDELLRRVKEVALDAYDNQELPYEQLVVELNPVRDPRWSPVVQVLFQLFQDHNYFGSDASSAMTNLAIRPFPTGCTTNVDIHVSCSEAQGGGLAGYLIYAADLYERRTMECYVTQFVRLLEQIAKHSRRRLSEFSVLTEVERGRRHSSSLTDLVQDHRSESEVADSEPVFLTPRNSLEEALADIWAEVLRIDRVGVKSNFFDLGGSSILSLQVIARAQQQGLTLSPLQLFENQTVAQLAAVLSQQEPASSGDDSR